MTVRTDVGSGTEDGGAFTMPTGAYERHLESENPDSTTKAVSSLDMTVSISFSDTARHMTLTQPTACNRDRSE